MAFFGLGKKKKFIDLTEHYKKQEERASEITSENQQDNFLGSLASASGADSSTETSSDYMDISGSLEEKRKKLAKRLIEMTNKMEDISNQLYHLQQRIEVLEKKTDVNRF